MSQASAQATTLAGFSSSQAWKRTRSPVSSGASSSATNQRAASIEAPSFGSAGASMSVHPSFTRRTRAGDIRQKVRSSGSRFVGRPHTLLAMGDAAGDDLVRHGNRDAKPAGDVLELEAAEATHLQRDPGALRQLGQRVLQQPQLLAA